MKARIVVLGALAFCLATPSAALDWQSGAKVRVATEGAYKPWNFRQTDGTLAGFEVDLVNVLCRDLGFECAIQAEAWSSMLRRLDEDNFDAIFAGMSITEARKTKATFSVPYAATPAVFVAPPGGRAPDTAIGDLTLPDLTGAEQDGLVAIRKAFLNGIVGVQKGTTHEIFLRDFVEGYARITTYESQTDLDADVARGRLAGMLVSMSYAVPLTKGAEKRGMRIVGPRISGGPFGEGIGAAFRKRDQKLAESFSRAIADRIADGTIRDLSMRWFGFDISAKP